MSNCRTARKQKSSSHNELNTWRKKNSLLKKNVNIAHTPLPVSIRQKKVRQTYEAKKAIPTKKNHQIKQKEKIEAKNVVYSK